ncbi:MAG: hypothetical protein JST00_33465, partial [Deltaproteobacteria bacterium]|nr:hypothetical protein [Deltaproteobacteria bacterium]
PQQGYPQQPQRPAAPQPPQEEFARSGPAPGAEKMFADDPEMLELIAAARKEQAKPGPRRKPWWWQLVVGGLGVVCAGVALLPTLVLDMGIPFHPLEPLSALLGGMLLAIAILGHYPGVYNITDEHGTTLEEKSTLWTPLPMGLRALAGLAFLVFPVVGFVLASLA